MRNNGAGGPSPCLRGYGRTGGPSPCLRGCGRAGGQAAAEFAAVLPFFFFAVWLVVKIILGGLGAMTSRFGVSQAMRPEFFGSGEIVKASRVAVPDAGFSNGLLQGGDTPSPYCRHEGEYKLCGYPAQE